jgi:class 3 adenylate cyclase
MMLALPFLETVPLTETSRLFGADYVDSAFSRLLNDTSSRRHYEETMLRYIYFHNAFPRRQSDPADNTVADQYFTHLIWFGVKGKDGGELDEVRAEGALSEHSVEFFNTNSSELFNYGTIPVEARERLASDWNEQCNQEGRSYFGVSLLSAPAYDGYEIAKSVRCPLTELRYWEYEIQHPTSSNIGERDLTWELAFIFDVREAEQELAMWNLAVTAFVMVLLVLGSAMFTADANRLVVNPVEKMIKRVEAIRDDPLRAIKMADEEYKAELMAKQKQKITGSSINKMLQHFYRCITCIWCSKSSGETNETVVLEKTIIKLGSLLALGFGEAGANIIGQNMRGSDSALVNVMIPGTRVECILGVARVSDFSTATEVLQGKIMTFVNRIAEIVHGIVNQYHGSPNKNSGDFFIVIWRLEDYQKNKSGSDADAKPARRSSDLRQVEQQNRTEEEEKAWRTTRIAEMSVVAFAQVLAAIQESPLLATYRSHPGLKFRLGKNCRVNLSFGLHLGWAIEGAVGSEYKIDASYLSPNVSIAMTVERCTKVYGVSLVMSQSVVEKCTRAMALKCRLIDRVQFAGLGQPLELYCLDLDYTRALVSQEQPSGFTWNSRNRFKARQFLESEKSSKWADEFDAAEIFDDNHVLRAMRRTYTEEFFQVFNMGFQNYSCGEWHVARRMLACSQWMLGVEDGPSNALLHFMEDPYMFEVPPRWQSVRDLRPEDIDLS